MPLAVGHVPPPDGQTLIEGMRLPAAIDAGALTPDNTYGMRAVRRVIEWLTDQ